MGELLSKGTQKFYGTIFDQDTALGKWNRLTDPAGAYIGDDALEKTGKQVEQPLPAPPPMPAGTDDEAVRRARRKKIATMQASSGRASTIYTDDGSARLGG